MKRVPLWISILDMAAWIAAMYGFIYANPEKITRAFWPLIAGIYMLVMVAFVVLKLKRTVEDEFGRFMAGLAWLALGLALVLGYNQASIFIVVPILVIFIFGTIWSSWRATRKEKPQGDGTSQTHLHS